LSVLVLSVSDVCDAGPVEMGLTFSSLVAKLTLQSARGKGEKFVNVTNGEEMKK
jgi:hypothetical protein